jgi:hypothetical protein
MAQTPKCVADEGGATVYSGTVGARGAHRDAEPMMVLRGALAMSRMEAERPGDPERRRLDRGVDVRHGERRVRHGSAAQPQTRNVPFTGT